jgi:integrase
MPLKHTVIERARRKRPLIRRSYDLRRCIGTILAEAGVEARLIHELLGHAGSERWRS